MRNLKLGRNAALAVVLGLVFCVGASANPLAPDQTAASAAAATREYAEAQLSQRYATLWATLPTAERAQFSARERQWLNVGRWQEKDACVAQRGAAAGSSCVLEVTLRHAATLDRGAVAVSN